MELILLIIPCVSVGLHLIFIILSILKIRPKMFSVLCVYCLPHRKDRAFNKHREGTPNRDPAASCSASSPACQSVGLSASVFLLSFGFFHSFPICNFCCSKSKHVLFFRKTVFVPHAFLNEEHEEDLVPNIQP